MFVTIVGSVLNCRKAMLYFHAPFNLCKSSAKRNSVGENTDIKNLETDSGRLPSAGAHT